MSRSHSSRGGNPARHPNRSGAVLPNPRRRAGLALPALPEHPNVLIQDPDPAPSPGPALVGIQIAATAVLGLTPTGKNLVLAPTALSTDADGARVHRPCLTVADTLAAGAHTAMTPKKTRTVMVTPGPIQTRTHVWVCLVSVCTQQSET